MSNQHYDGSVVFNYNNEEYEADVLARGTYSFRKGRMYMRNGDPGYPDEESFEIDDIEVEAVFDAEGNEVSYTEDMYDCIEEALNDVDWEIDDYEPPEPEDDWINEEDAYERCYGNG